MRAAHEFVSKNTRIRRNDGKTSLHGQEDEADVKQSDFGITLVVIVFIAVLFDRASSDTLAILVMLNFIIAAVEDK